jgi:hypothetical protein
VLHSVLVRQRASTTATLASIDASMATDLQSWAELEFHPACSTVADWLGSLLECVSDHLLSCDAADSVGTIHYFVNVTCFNSFSVPGIAADDQCVYLEVAESGPECHWMVVGTACSCSQIAG